MPFEKCSAVPIQKCSAQVQGSSGVVPVTTASWHSAGCDFGLSRLFLGTSFASGLALPPRLLQAIALAGGFQQMAAVRQAIQGRAHQTLVAEHLRPALEGQV